MKNIIKTIAYIAIAAAAAGCAKSVPEGANDANIRYFKSWLHVNHPDLKPTGLGIYVLENEGGEGLEKVEEDGFVYADYVVTDLQGNITSYTGANTAKQLGEYNRTFYYGPTVMTTIEQTIPAGVAEGIIGMRIGERKKFIVPSWLMSYTKYDTEEEYLNNISGSSSAIYDITIRAYTDSIAKYEEQQILDYMRENQTVFNSWVKPVQRDTVFYYQCLKKPAADAEKFPHDTTIYINYTGRLLNGQVFDTTIEDVAKDYGIYSSAKDYVPAEVTWSDKFEDIRFGDSSVIPGFALTLWQMKPYEKGIGVFASTLGYSYSGSGNSIPGYAPLVFEIEIVDKPEE